MSNGAAELPGSLGPEEIPKSCSFKKETGKLVQRGPAMPPGFMGRVFRGGGRWGLTSGAGGER